MAGTGGYLTVGILILGGWAFLEPQTISWLDVAACAVIEFWLLRRVRSAGRGAPEAGQPPYHFTDEEAQLVGRYRFYFTYPAVARDASSVLSAIGLSAMILALWLTFKGAFMPAALVWLNLFAVGRFTKQLAPVFTLRIAARSGDRAALRMLELHDPLWEKIRAANRDAPLAG